MVDDLCKKFRNWEDVQILSIILSSQADIMSCSECIQLKVRGPGSVENGAFPVQKSPSPIRYPLEIGQPQIHKLKELQGQCKVITYQLLLINYPKAIFFVFLMTISIVGLLFLKYYKKLRALMFYTALEDYQIQKATHIYVQGTDKNQSICEISSAFFDGNLHRVFTFKHLRYEHLNRDCIPLGLRYLDSISDYNRQFIARGLDIQQVQKRQSFYGKNQHLVEVPNYFEYLFDVMTKPFFIFQYLVSLVYILENVAIFGVLMIVFGFLTTSINYILLVRSYGKIKETAEKEFEVTVFRNKTFQNIQNVDLVCGDLYVPHGQIPCDSIILAGDLFMDEASLTGEAVPIPKFKLEDYTKVQQKNHWVYQGSMVKTKKQGTLALAVNTGFGSCRGRIIRKILTKTPKQPQFFKKMIYFLAEVMIVSFILFGATFYQMFTLDIEKIMIFFRFLDFITYSFPAPLPIFFNLTYSFCLVRLHRDGIYGTESEKTIESARMKTICFDKTGTLTQNGMKVANIFAAANNDTLTDVTSKIYAFPLISDIFGCCHSVQLINNNYQGDQIDLKMFHHVNAKIAQNSALNATHNVLRCISIDDRTYEILRINEYQSRFQSMSVLYRNRESKKCYIAAKGSPEMIHNYSQTKINQYQDFIKKMSLQGYRSIGFGCKQIPQREVVTFLKAQRQYFLKNINILGVVTFVNLLKDDAQSTIRTLTECEINTKIITGDNIFLGVQTALLTGMIPVNTRIIVLEGSKCKPEKTEITQLIKLENGQIRQSQRSVESFAFASEANIAYAIDNDFIKANPHNFLHNRVKVFARITPQNKALIVRKHKEFIRDKIKSRSYWQRIFGETSLKVGMVGDGANDLIAIKEADVGIGISCTDAVYSASFAVKDLSQIIEIICQSKNTQRQIVDMTQYFSIVNFLSITSTIILTSDVSYATSMQLIYKNFLTTILLTLFFALSRPQKQLSKYLPNSNFMGLENHLVFWISCVILTAAQVASYFYYYNTGDFVSNPQPSATFSSGWNGVCKSATINFLITVLEFSILPFFIFRSSPWKEPIYKNWPLTVLILINIALIISIYFFTSKMSIIDLQTIGTYYAGVVLAITGGGCLLCGVANLIIQKGRFHEFITNQDQLDLQQSENSTVCKMS